MVTNIIKKKQTISENSNNNEKTNVYCQKAAGEQEVAGKVKKRRARKFWGP